MRKLFLSRAIMAGLFAISAVAMAQKGSQTESYRYSWHDDKGQPHFSDSLTRDAIKNGYDVLNSSGLVVRHVRRQLTPEERKIADAKEAKQAAERAKAERQHAQDMQMLNAYPNERVFRDAQQAEIDELTQGVHTTKLNLHAQEQNLAELLAHVADLKQAGNPVPAYLSKRIDEQRAAVSDQRATLNKQQKAKDDAVKRVAERIARYRKLRAEEKAGKL